MVVMKVDVMVVLMAAKMDLMTVEKKVEVMVQLRADLTVDLMAGKKVERLDVTSDLQMVVMMVAMMAER